MSDNTSDNTNEKEEKEPKKLKLELNKETVRNLNDTARLPSRPVKTSDCGAGGCGGG